MGYRRTVYGNMLDEERLSEAFIMKYTNILAVAIRVATPTIKTFNDGYTTRTAATAKRRPDIMGPIPVPGWALNSGHRECPSLDAGRAVFSSALWVVESFLLFGGTAPRPARRIARGYVTIDYNTYERLHSKAKPPRKAGGRSACDRFLLTAAAVGEGNSEFFWIGKLGLLLDGLAEVANRTRTALMDELHDPNQGA